MKEFMIKHPIISLLIATGAFETIRRGFKAIENVITYSSYSSAYKKYVNATANGDNQDISTPERYGILYSTSYNNGKELKQKDADNVDTETVKKAAEDILEKSFKKEGEEADGHDQDCEMAGEETDCEEGQPGHAVPDDSDGEPARSDG